MIFHVQIDTKEGDEAEILSLLIENYENKHYLIDAPDPIEPIKKTIGRIKYASKGFGRNNRWEKPAILNS